MTQYHWVLAYVLPFAMVTLGAYYFAASVLEKASKAYLWAGIVLVASGALICVAGLVIDRWLSLPTHMPSLVLNLCAAVVMVSVYLLARAGGKRE